MEKSYRFAGVDITVEIPDQWAYTGESWLKDFGIAEPIQPWTFQYCPVSGMEPPEGRCIYRGSDIQVWENGDLRRIYRGAVSRTWENAYLCTESRGKAHLVRFLTGACPGPLNIKNVLDGLNAAHLINQAGGCILHCSYIAHKGKAILFTAPSGVGKSTQAALWKAHRGATIVNGDRTAVAVVNGIPMARAIPFAGSSPYCLNQDLPIAAVVYLGQAKSASIQPLRGVQAFRKLWEGCTVNIWDEQDVSLATRTITELVQAVPVFHLDCPPDQTAVQALESYLTGR